MGCDRVADILVEIRFISIHAPQWGATGHGAQLVAADRISIHAPQWGATRCVVLASALSWIFQSTHPSGVRLECHAQPCAQLVISIHAPQWGATADQPRLKRMAVISIHAPQWGATCLSDGHVADLIISIHAPQWGATHRRWTGESLSLNFNPRTPVGCDVVMEALKPICGISIHAPQWGATICQPLASAILLFQSTHPSGVRLTDEASDVLDKVFQSTHPSGVRRRHSTS